MRHQALFGPGGLFRDGIWYNGCYIKEVDEMGASDLRDAFNAVTAPAFNCQRATLHYEQAHDVESQVLTFTGNAADGAPFEINSGPLRPGVDVNLAARATAQQLLDQGKPAA